MEGIWDFDPIYGTAVTDTGSFFYHEPFSAINAAVSAMERDVEQPTMMRKIVQARIDAPLIRDKYKSLVSSSARVDQAPSMSAAFPQGSGARSTATYYFNPKHGTSKARR
jgi:hypothetical protein